MTADDFTAAARESADQYRRAQMHHGTTTDREVAAHIAGWRAARDHLAGQEETEEEVEAARLALHQALAPDWMGIAAVLGADQREYDGLLDELARAALAAARRVRQGERGAVDAPRARCGCDLSGMYPPAAHIVDGHEDR